jgi:hypothetical protein
MNKNKFIHYYYNYYYIIIIDRVFSIKKFYFKKMKRFLFFSFPSQVERLKFRTNEQRRRIRKISHNILEQEVLELNQGIVLY